MRWDGAVSLFIVPEEDVIGETVRGVMKKMLHRFVTGEGIKNCSTSPCASAVFAKYCSKILMPFNQVSGSRTPVARTSSTGTSSTSSTSSAESLTLSTRGTWARWSGRWWRARRYEGFNTFGKLLCLAKSMFRSRSRLSTPLLTTPWCGGPSLGRTGGTPWRW